MTQKIANVARAVIRVVEHGLPSKMSLQHACAFYEIGYAEMWEKKQLDIVGLSGRCQLSRSAATRTVANLSDLNGGLGLIKLQPEKKDRRRKQLLLTKAGRNVFLLNLMLIEKLHKTHPDYILREFKKLEGKSLPEQVENIVGKRTYDGS